MADAPTIPSADSPPPGNGRKRKAIGLFLLVLAATVIAGFVYWRYRQTHVSTDDAYIDGRIHLISARVQGTVSEVRVRDNQPVRTGDPLLLIDPEPFAVRESAAVSAVSGGRRTWSPRTRTSRRRRRSFFSFRPESRRPGRRPSFPRRALRRRPATRRG